jgi:hypothetical protein
MLQPSKGVSQEFVWLLGFVQIPNKRTLESLLNGNDVV